MTGPAGTPCPVCGHYLNVFGCKPGECKAPPDPIPGDAGVISFGADACAICRGPGATVVQRDPDGTERGRVHAECLAAAPADSAPFIASRPELGALRESLARVAACSRVGDHGPGKTCSECGFYPWPPAKG